MTALKLICSSRIGGPTMVAVLSLLLVACGPQDGAPSAQSAVSTAVKATPKPAPVKAPVVRGALGTITSVTTLRSQAQPSGAGVVLGGVVGAALGNQVGKGNGRKAATVLGAVGGAVAGNEIEKGRSTSITGYRVDVALDDGTHTSVTLASDSGFATGQRVRLVDGALRPV